MIGRLNQAHHLEVNGGARALAPKMCQTVSPLAPVCSHLECSLYSTSVNVMLRNDSLSDRIVGSQAAQSLGLSLAMVFILNVHCSQWASTRLPVSQGANKCNLSYTIKIGKAMQHVG
jgi:hypothetical protein